MNDLSVSNSMNPGFLPATSDQSETSLVRILLVTDNSSTLHTILQVLIDHPELVVVGSGIDCPQVLDQALDLKAQMILIDLDIRDQSVRRTIACLRRTLPDIVIIVLSFSDIPMYWNLALEAGANEVIQKLSIGSELWPVCQQVILKESC